MTNRMNPPPESPPRSKPARPSHPTFIRLVRTPTGLLILVEGSFVVRSAFEHSRLGFVVVVTGGRGEVVELGDLLGSELDGVGCDVLL